MAKTRSRIKKEPKKDISCMRGKAGWLHIRRNDLTGCFSLTVRDKEINRICTVDMYPHEAERLYDFLGKVLA